MGQWVKARTSSSSHYGKWHYIYIRDSLFERENREFLIEHLEDTLGANTSHHTYHGVQWQRVKVENIPKEVFQYKIDSLKATYKDALASIKYLEDEASKCKIIQYSLKCTSCNGTGRAFDFIRKKGQSEYGTKGRKVFRKEIRMVEFSGTQHDANACIRCNGTGRVKDYSPY